jgi:two-component system, chemotaxis family, chemotaxis protein CheY
VAHIKPLVLLVEDQEVVRQPLALLLTDSGYAVEEANNGASALQAARRLDGSLSLIIADINMPVMDGLEFVKRLQTVERARGVPVVMITTEASEKHVLQALSCGARGYIRKPFTPEQVREHVLGILEQN